MRDLHKVREQEGLLLAPTQVYALLGLLAVALGLTFILGFYVGRKAPPPAAPGEDPLVPADVQTDSVALLLARAAEEEAEANAKEGPDLQFHDILPSRTGEEGEAPPPSGAAAVKPQKVEGEGRGTSSTVATEDDGAADKAGSEVAGGSEKTVRQDAGAEQKESSKGDKAAPGEKGEKAEKEGAKPDRSAKAEKGEKEAARPEKSAKSEKEAAKTEKSEKSAKSEKSEKEAAKSERSTRSQKDAKSEKDTRSAKEAHDKSDKDSHSDKKTSSKDKADKDSAASKSHKEASSEVADRSAGKSHGHEDADSHARDSHGAKKETLDKEAASRPEKAGDRKAADSKEKERVAEGKKSVKEESPAPAEKSAGKGFTVQVSSYQEASVADKLVRQLGAQGFSAYKVAAEVNGHTWYRVRIGAFDSKESAEKEMQRLKAARSELNPMIAHR